MSKNSIKNRKIMYEPLKTTFTVFNVAVFYLKNTDSTV